MVPKGRAPLGRHLSALGVSPVSDTAGGVLRGDVETGLGRGCRSTVGGGVAQVNVDNENESQARNHRQLNIENTAEECFAHGAG